MKKLLSLFLILTTSLLVCTGCKSGGNDETPDEKKYDVSMKIVIEGVGEYIFTPDVEEMTVTIPYDGVSRKVYISGYQFPDHPDENYSKSWLAPKFSGADYFGRSMSFKDENGEHDLNRHEIKECGEYMFYCYADTTSKKWNFRSIWLKIIVE